jgi:excinuclease UvrABC nuclease subunit
LIDVIREKVSVDEGDFSHMLAGFEMEIGELIPLGAEGMIVHSQSMKFLKSEEQALQQMLDKFFDSYVISASFEGDNLQNELLQTLQKRYGLKKFPYRMECVDISHLSGSWISGGLTCMIGGLLEKKGYRKYKIQSVKGQSDDYASLKEVLERRLKYNEPRRDGS